MSKGQPWPSRRRDAGDTIFRSTSSKGRIMHRNSFGLSLFGIVACVMCSAVAAAAADRGTLFRVEEPGQTVPSQEAELGFAVPGLISKVNVKDGEVIKKG